MPLTKLKEFLDRHNVEYATISHSVAYTAEQTAKSAHVPAQELAKTVMIKIDGRMAMAVLPASFHVDFDAFRETLGAERVELAVEDEFKDVFVGCDVGAMPPFGNLYGLDVFVASRLAEDEVIAFNAGTHTELIKMRFSDFENLVKPRIFRFCLQPV